jgi:hypothetical protein
MILSVLITVSGSDQVTSSPQLRSVALFYFLRSKETANVFLQFRPGQEAARIEIAV